jgi:hypothetical protein
MEEFRAKHAFAAIFRSTKEAQDDYQNIMKQFPVVQDAHKMVRYSNNLEVACRETQSAPYPDFTRFVTINRWLGDMGW